jgi:uncharacterized membrane protein (UPF0182 family)
MMSSDEIARERTLLQGSNTLTNGNLLTLPVGDGQILYVEPVYSQRADQESAFPKLLRVLVSYNGQVGYAPTISGALEQVGIDPGAVTDVAGDDGSSGNTGSTDTDGDSDSDADKDDSSEDQSSGSGATSGTGTGAAPTAEQMTRINDAMEAVQDARENGTFEEFGKALDELDAAIAAADK